MNKTEDLFPEEDKNSFEAAFAWWEKRRLRYNIIVGIPGLLLVLLNLNNLNLWSFISIGLFGIAANGFYCLGYLGEFFLKYYFHFTTDFSDRRNTVYWIGVSISVLVEFAFAVLAVVTEPVK